MRVRLANRCVGVTAVLVVWFAFWLVLVAVPAQAQTSSTAYSDLSENTWYYEHVVALEAMGIFEGTDCEEGFCPDDPLERWQMAVWLVRIIDGKDPASINESRFTDVDNYSEWMHFIDRLAELEITTGCWRDPPRYCPGQPVSRQQMASFLTRAFKLPEAGTIGFTDVDPNNTHFKDINSLAASGITTGCWRDPPRYCPSDSVTKAQMATFIGRTLNWQKKQAGEEIITTNPNPHLNLSPNPANPNPNNIPGYNPDIFYTEENDLSRFVKEEVVDRYAEDNPWLLEAWNHTNRPDFKYKIRNLSASVDFLRINSKNQPNEDLDKYIVVSLIAHHSHLNDKSVTIFVHELAHVYTLSEGATANPVPVAIAHLYFDQLSAGNGLCTGEELYADAAEMLVPAKYNHFHSYWHSCSHLPSTATPEAIQVVEDAFAGKIPQWFYDTFQRSDGSLDYEMLWSAVKNMLIDDFRINVVYQLKDAFGGYCSDISAKESAFGDLQLAQPWRDGGCPVE